VNNGLLWPIFLSLLLKGILGSFVSYMVLAQKRGNLPMADQSEIPTADAVEAFVASLRQRSAPVNTIKSYAHDLRLFVRAMPADLSTVTAVCVSM
jgi:hypothetical protein